jgi:uncharacterized protein (UPF0548 family)
VTVSAHMQRRLDEFSGTPVNYDVDALDLEHPPAGWHVDDRRQPLPAEPPGQPVSEGSFELACRLIRSYKFADPSMVRAFYDPKAPLAGRTMVLELRALGLFSVHVGVRVGDVYDETRSIHGREARVFGWAYRTLEGHVEMGQMNWEVWKWLDTGEVDFHVHSVSRPASISNPVIRIGFWLLRGHERALFLDSTSRRMKAFTELGGQREGLGQRIRDAGPGLTARRLPAGDPSHADLARQLDG